MEMTTRLIDDLKKLGEIGAHQPIGERNTIERLLAVVAKNSRRLNSVPDDEDRNEVISSAYMRSHEEVTEYSPREETPFQWAARMLDNERKNFINAERRKGGAEPSMVQFTNANNENIASLDDPMEAAARLLAVEKIYTLIKSVAADERKAVVMLLEGGTTEEAVAASGVSDYRVRKLKKQLENLVAAVDQSDLSIGVSTVNARAQEIDDGVTCAPDYETGDDQPMSRIDRELSRIGPREPTAPERSTGTPEQSAEAKAAPQKIEGQVRAIRRRRAKFVAKLTPEYREKEQLIVSMMSDGYVEREVAKMPKAATGGAPGTPNQVQQS